MRQSKPILIAVTIVAMAFVGQRAQSCSGTHISTTGTGSADMNCITQGNIDYTANSTVDVPFGQSFDNQMLTDVINQITAGGPGTQVNVQDWAGTNLEAQIQFTVPSGAHEVTFNITSPPYEVYVWDGTYASAWDGTYNADGSQHMFQYQHMVDAGYTTGGGAASETLILQNGKFVPIASVPNANPCTAGGSTPPINTKGAADEDVKDDVMAAANDSSAPAGMNSSSKANKESKTNSTVE